MDLMWQRSSRCDSGWCVEVARTPDGVAVRNNQWPGDVLRFGAGDWRRFLADLAGGVR